MDHEEQTRWLINYLEKRFERIEARIDDALAAQAKALKEMKQDIEEVEHITTKLSTQTGLIKNILLIIIPGALSLAGWIITNILMKG